MQTILSASVERAQPCSCAAISKIAEVNALGYNGANMPNPNSIVLAATAEAKRLKSVLVGGNAVNLYGYHRTTFAQSVESAVRNLVSDADNLVCTAPRTGDL
jgi:hypothetical protein